MRNRSPRLAALRRNAGHDAVHIRDVGMARDDDVTVLHHAQTDDRVLVTADTDFGGLLEGSGQRLPSVVLLSRIQGRKAAVQAQRLLDHLEDVRDDLEAGSIVTFEDARLRVRRLPL